MTGLIVKDFLILSKTLRTYLFMIIIYAALCITGVWGPEILGAFLMVIVAMLPLNVFAYDKQAKWDTYGLALPVGRTKTVAARYLCVLLLCLISIVLTAVMGVVVSALGRVEDVRTYIFSSAVMGVLSIAMNAILLPFLYKFGPDKARIMFIGFFGGVFGVGLLLMRLHALDWLKGWEPTPQQTAAAPFLAALAGLVLLALSFLLSSRIYGKKDV